MRRLIREMAEFRGENAALKLPLYNDRNGNREVDESPEQGAAARSALRSIPRIHHAGRKHLACYGFLVPYITMFHAHQRIPGIRVTMESIAASGFHQSSDASVSLRMRFQ